MRRRWIVLGAAVSIAAAVVVPAARRRLHKDAGAGSETPLSIAKVEPVAPGDRPAAPALAGLDLTKIGLGKDGAVAPLPDKRTARLTIDPALERTAHAVMAMHHIPEAAVVLMEVATGKVLVYATHIEKGPARDLCVEATAPAASVFKIVTATSLVENAGITPDRRECYSGGEQRITMTDLTPDPKRDRWCTTVAGAMGRSINTVFARLALANLKPPTLEATARSLGFGEPLAFDVPVQASGIRFPEEPLAFARTAAGFWNTSLSPLHAAWISATVARGGEPIRPVLVRDVVDASGKVVWTGAEGLAQKRAMKAETAKAVTAMMDETVAQGTSYRAFHDVKGQAFLPGIAVAGKTGTLTDHAAKRFYTWFTGFAPSRPYEPGDAADDDEDVDGAGDDKRPSPPEVAIGVLVVNQPKWQIKANVLAREVLRAYFAGQKVPSVTVPKLRAAHPSTTPGTKHRRHRGS